MSAKGARPANLQPGAAEWLSSCQRESAPYSCHPPAGEPEETDNKLDSVARISLTLTTMRSSGVVGGSALEDHLESLVLRMYQGGILYSEALREFQKMFVITVLREQNWNQARAADTLNMHHKTLQRLIHEFQIDLRSLRAARRPPPERARPLPLDKKIPAT
jgi:Fis family transcriptional regulator